MVCIIKWFWGHIQRYSDSKIIPLKYVLAKAKKKKRERKKRKTKNVLSSSSFQISAQI